MHMAAMLRHIAAGVMAALGYAAAATRAAAAASAMLPVRLLVAVL